MCGSIQVKRKNYTKEAYVNAIQSVYTHGQLYTIAVNLPLIVSVPVIRSLLVATQQRVVTTQPPLPRPLPLPPSPVVFRSTPPENGTAGPGQTTYAG